MGVPHVGVPRAASFDHWFIEAGKKSACKSPFGASATVVCSFILSGRAGLEWGWLWVGLR